MSAPTLDRTRPPEPAPLRPFHFPDVHRRTLPNGLELLVCEVRDFPVVTVDVVMPCGGTAEPEERAGVALATAALLESGAGGRDAEELAETVDALGLMLDHGVSWDSTRVGCTALRARREAAFEIVADLARRPAFPQPEVERVRTQRLTSLAQNRDDPTGLALEVSLRSIFPEGSPYGRMLTGCVRTLGALGRGDIAAFHAGRYRPQGAALLAVGDLSTDEAEALAERFFGDWAGAPEPFSPAAAPRREEGLRFVVADRPGSVQSALRVGHVGVARDVPDFFAVTVMNSILGGMFASRLNLNLRERLGYTYGAHSVFSMRRQPGPFSMTTAVQTEVTAHAVSEMLREMREMRDAPPRPEELSDARTYLAGAFPLALETTDGVAGKLQTLFTYDLPRDYYATYRDRVMAVTAEDVQAAARTHLHPEHAVVVVAGDAERVVPALEALGEGPVEVVEPAEVLD